MIGKSRCKDELQRELGLASAPQVPLVVWVSRITHQKMVDTVLEVLPALLDRDIQLALMGQGDADAERALVGQAIASRAKMAVRIGYDEGLAHRLMRREICCCTRRASNLAGWRRFMRCATAPCQSCAGSGGLLDNVVAATEDTIRNGTATGFTFQDANGSALLDCVNRALAAYAQPLVWRRIQQQAMTRDFELDGLGAAVSFALPGLGVIGHAPCPATSGWERRPAPMPVAATQLRRMHGIWKPQ